jgi:hypothetical protein
MFPVIDPAIKFRWYQQYLPERLAWVKKSFLEAVRYTLMSFCSHMMIPIV